MYVATNRIKVQKPHGPDLEELFQNRAGLEHQPGFLTFELWKLQSEAEHEDYLVVSHWETKEAHDDWTRSEAFRSGTLGLSVKLHPGTGRVQRLRRAGCFPGRGGLTHQ